MVRCTAFVLGGGGSHGALQVGALRALLEAGIVPDLLVGTSIGAVNATALALWGADLQGVDSLERFWKDLAGGGLLEPKIRWLFLRSILGRASSRAREKVEHLFALQGLTPDLRFRDLTRIRLALIGADLGTGQPVIYGKDPDDSVAEGLLGSIAVPPWFPPLRKGGRLIVDGGALSNLPIEPAMDMGATGIFALDLDNSYRPPADSPSAIQYVGKFIYSISRRYVHLETALAEALGVPVRTIAFEGLARKPMWDFSEYRGLITAGYDKAKRQIDEWNRRPDEDEDFAISRALETIAFPGGRWTQASYTTRDPAIPAGADLSEHK
jgi:NTE family protein